MTPVTTSSSSRPTTSGLAVERRAKAGYRHPAARGLGARELLLLLPFTLLFVGDLQIPVSGSSITVPTGMVLIFPALLVMIASLRLTVSAPVVMLIGVLAFGVAGAVSSPAFQVGRSMAGALPIVFVIGALLVYERQRLSHELAIKFMLSGGMLLAIAVIGLFIASLGSGGDYYEQKLLIETPLGRSNYLAAFLVFMVALALPTSIWLAAFFSAAVLCTMSRGGALMLVFLPIVVLLARQKRLWWIGVGVLLVFSLAIAAVVTSALDISSVVEALADPGDDRFDSTANRLLLWNFGLDLWSSSPIFGIGPNTFRTFVESSDGVEDVWGVHNSILLMLLNYGVAGLLLYLSYLRVVYRSIMAAEVDDGRFLYVRSGLVVLLIFSLFEPLVGSAAFELLVAFTYILSRVGKTRPNHLANLSPSGNAVRPKLRT